MNYNICNNNVLIKNNSYFGTFLRCVSLDLFHFKKRMFLSIKELKCHNLCSSRIKLFLHYILTCNEQEDLQRQPESWLLLFCLFLFLCGQDFRRTVLEVLT